MKKLFLGLAMMLMLIGLASAGFYDGISTRLKLCTDFYDDINDYTWVNDGGVDITGEPHCFAVFYDTHLTYQKNKDQLIAPDGDMTVCLNIFHNGVPRDNYVFSEYSGSYVSPYTGNGFMAYISDNNKMHLVYANGNNSVDKETSLPLTSDVWYSVCIAHNNATGVTNYYVNGDLTDTFTDVYTTKADAYPILGWFTGRMKFETGWERPITSTEVNKYILTGGQFDEGVCGATTITEEGTGQNTKYVYSNNCLQIRMRKFYNPNIEINTSVLNTVYSTKPFKLLLVGMEERDRDSSAKTLTLFEDLSLSSDASQDYLRYYNDDLEIGYRIVNGESFKTVLRIWNWTWQYNNSDLWLKVFYKKDAGEFIEYVPAVVDSVEQPLVVQYETAGLNEFAYQKIGRGYLMLVDPVFTFTTPYTPSHTTGDVVGVVIDFAVEYGLQMVTFAGLIALISLGVLAMKYFKK